MPTTDERREVAARLRSLKFTFEDDLEDELSAFYDALECNPGQKRWETNPYWFLAVLIEPEPERTCRNEFDRCFAFECSECGVNVEGGDMLGHNSSEGAFNFCPNCGARVVGE